MSKSTKQHQSRRRVVFSFSAALLISGVLSGCTSLDQLIRDDCGHCPNCCPPQSVSTPQPQDLTQLPMPPEVPDIPQPDLHQPPITESSDDIFAPTRELPLPIADEAAAEIETLKTMVADLDERVSELQKQLEQERARKEAVDRQLVAVNRSVNRLSAEIDYYRDELKRIADDSERNHLKDLETLRKMAELVDELSQESASGIRRQ